MHVCPAAGKLSLTSLIFFFAIFLSSWSVFAGSRLKIDGDEILIFSGASYKYRPIARARKGRTYPVSKSQVSGPDGDFYKVLLVYKGKRRRVGYISVNEKVRVVKGKNEDEDVDKYESLSLAASSIQMGFQILKEGTYFWNIGYQKYPSESLYLKASIGQVMNRTTGNTTLGGEVGYDQNAFGKFSTFISFGTGLVLIPAADNLFLGSSTINMYTQGTAGLRFNADEFAAFSFGIFQMAIFNSANSFTSLGAAFSLEVGL